MLTDEKKKEHCGRNVLTSVINSWLEIRFEERELYNKELDDSSIARIRELLDG